MIIDSPIISGSHAASGSLNQHGDVVITGSLTVTGTINGSITGSITTASYALNAETLDGLDNTSFTTTSSFTTYTSSTDASILSNTQNIVVLYASASSLDSRVTKTEATASSLTTASGSFSTRVSSNESNISSLQTASGSFSTRTTNLETASGSFSTRVTNNESNISSLQTASGSFSTRTTNLETASGSFSTRVTSTEGSVTSLNSKTGSYATTSSNNFINTQYISAANNAVSFTSTASLYTDGGVRVTKDMYVSGTAYFNNVTVFGTQSVQYITSSQLNISTNLISVNTDTPTVRFGGLAVYDSGSTGLSGSMLWDSEQNHWVYTNPSGSTYSGGMLISGPRASSLGTEQGTTSCMLLAGQGGDHLTSSMIYHSSTATCIPNTLIGNVICAGTVCAPAFIGGTVNATAAANTYLGGSLILKSADLGTSTYITTVPNQFALSVSGSADHLLISSAGAATFCAASTGYGLSVTNVLDDAQGLLVRATDNDPSLFIFNAQSSNAATCTGFVSRMAITKQGRVGIANETPNNLLEVGNNACLYPSVIVRSQAGYFPTVMLTRGDGTFSTVANSNWLLGNSDNGFEISRVNSLSSSSVTRCMYFQISCNGKIGINFTAGGVALKANLDILSDEGAVPLVLRGRPSDGEGQVEFWNCAGTTRYGVLGSTSNYTYLGSIANTRLFFQTNSTERFSISNTGISCFACQVCASAFQTPGCIAVASTSWIGFNGFDRTHAIGYDATVDGVYVRGQNGLRFITGAVGGTERMRLDASGNLGLGATPDSWASGWRAFNFGSNGAIAYTGAGANDFSFSLNSYYDSADDRWEYRYTGDGASRYSMTALTSEHRWFVAPIGTANAAISWNQAMTLKSSGNLGLGTTTPCALLQITTPSTNSVLFPAILNNPYNDGVAGYGVGLRLQNSTITGAQETNKWAGIAAIAGGSSGYSNETDLAFYVGCFISAANCTCPPVEKMRIQSSTGYVGIGTTSPIAQLQICSPDGQLRLSGDGRAQMILSTYAKAWQFETSCGVGNVSACGIGIVEAGSGTRFQISPGGVACFSNTVCMPMLLASGCVGIGTTVGTAALGIGGTGQTTANLTDAGSRSGIIEIIPVGGAAGNGGALVLGSDTWGTGAGRGQVALKALLVNGSGCGTSDLAFSLRNNPTCSNLTERMRITVDGNVLPGANGTQDLGSSSLRWCTVYTSDLSLNNGIGNYTIVEGENDLFLYNNNSCKVYKFVVQEVCPEIAPAKRSI